jgi:uncharacterized protein
MIFYLHGFRSGPQSSKVQQLANRMAQLGLSDQLWCEQLPHQPFEAIALVEAALRAADDARAIFVGSSLGGFYATWLAERHGLKAALINPFVPHTGFDFSLFLGEHENLYSGERFQFSQAHVEQVRVLDCPTLRHPENLWLLAETDDEVLDCREAVLRYAGCRQTVLVGGNHAFTQWPAYIDRIIEFAGLQANT